MLKNHGFIEPIFEEEHYELGGLGLVEKPVLNTMLNWLPYIPYGEKQRKYIETNSCTEFGFFNQLETLEGFQYGESTNWSERFLAIGAENKPTGNDPHKVMEWARHNGIVREEFLAFVEEIETWGEYMQPNPLPDHLIKEAKKWLRRYDFKHEWLWKDRNLPVKEKQKRILNGLQYSPIAVSVYAWTKKNGIYYKPKRARDNHWTVIVKGEKKQPWMVYDSYIDDDFIKPLDWGFDFGVAKLITLDKKPEIIHPNWIIDFFYGLTRGRPWAL